MLIIDKRKNLVQTFRQFSAYFNFKRNQSTNKQPKDYKFSNILVFNKVSRFKVFFTLYLYV